MSLCDWEQLPATLKYSNLHQASKIGQKLSTLGYVIVPVGDKRACELSLSPSVIEQLAEMEHQRWVEERLSQGWRFGQNRDVDSKISPHLVGWEALSDEMRDLDRDAVRLIPELLAQAALAVAPGGTGAVT